MTSSSRNVPDTQSDEGVHLHDSRFRIFINDISDAQRKQDRASILSDYSIANKFLFRKTYNYRMDSRWPEFFMGSDRSGYSIASPKRNLLDVSEAIIAEILNLGCKIYPVSADVFDYFRNTVSGLSMIEAHPDQFDYLYLNTDLSRMEGRKFRRHRNYINQLLKNNKVVIEKIDNSNISAVSSVNEMWLARKFSSSSFFDYEECSEAIKYFFDLNLSGVLCTVDGIPAAISIVDDNFNEMVVALFQKSCLDMDGLDMLCVSYVAKIYENSKTFTNLCQDLGLEGLRNRKRSYCPAKIEKKFYLCLNESS